MRLEGHEIRLKVSYVIQQYPPEVGAGAARASEMVPVWNAAGADVDIVTAMPNRPVGRIHPEFRGRLFDRERRPEGHVYRSWLYASPRHGFARTLANNLTFMATGALHAVRKAARPDVLIASSPPFFVHLTGEFLRRWWRVPLVLEVRDLWPDYLASMGVVQGLPLKALLRLERYLFRRADHVVVVTESFKGRVAGKGVPEERITVLPNGVDPSFYARLEDPEPVEGFPPSRDDGFTVGYLGNFGRSQRLETVVDAAGRTEGRIHFVLAGGGTEAAKLKAAVKRQDLDNLTLLGPVEKRQTVDFYNRCDAVIVPLAPFPALQETVPSKIFEIMACERPVIGSFAGEAEKILRASGGGLVVPPGDPDALAEAVVEMQSLGPDGRREMGRRGRAYVERYYDRSALAREYLKTLTRVASR